MGLLESAVARPQATSSGIDLCADLWAKAAALMHSLTRNHPFVDGNKRTALAAASLSLELNGHRPAASNDQAMDFTRQVTAGDIELADRTSWFRIQTRR